MAEQVIPALGQSLLRNAERFNALFAAAEASGPIDAEHFATHLRDVVAPIVEAVAELPGGDNATIDAATLALYTNSLSLVARGLLASDTPSPYLHHLYTSALPGMARFLRDDPRRLVKALTTALPRLARQGEELPSRWLESLLSLSNVCHTTAELLDLGKVLSWTHGMAHYRDSALAVYQELPPRVQAVLPAAEELATPWPPQEDVTLLGTAGAFTGFGGHFAEPPLLGYLGDHLIAFDGEHHFWIHADRFGATCTRVHEDDLPDEPSRPAPALAPKLLNLLPEDLRQDHRSVAAAGNVLALTVPFSFSIYLFHVPEGLLG